MEGEADHRREKNPQHSRKPVLSRLDMRGRIACQLLSARLSFTPPTIRWGEADNPGPGNVSIHIWKNIPLEVVDTPKDGQCLYWALAWHAETPVDELRRTLCRVGPLYSVSYTHLTLPTNREV